MLEELIKNKIYYKVFDKSYPDSTHNYNIHTFKDQVKIDQVKNNIDKVVSDFSAKNILLLNQVHGNKVVCVDDSNADLNSWPEADASVTTKTNLILAIRTADCVPILFASNDGTVIGSAHCGWRSAKLDIIDKLAKSMRQKGASNILAIIGPSIAQESYEVSKDFYEDFTGDSNIYEDLFLPSKNQAHYMFDLLSFVKKKLKKANITIVKHINEDTYVMADKYPSYRRCTHTGEVYNQNILSAIVIK